jgi:predicted HAD superfamily Cof-like phosphohydrolase
MTKEEITRWVVETVTKNERVAKLVHQVAHTADQSAREINKETAAQLHGYAEGMIDALTVLYGGAR